MTDNEKKLVIALVRMVDQYLDRYGDEVDSRSMSAGEQAIEVLAGFGLMEAVNTRFGRWTEAGNKVWKRSACDVLSRWIIRPRQFRSEDQKPKKWMPPTPPISHAISVSTGR